MFFCPMHPEVEKPTKGDCPICGMALEELFKGDDIEYQSYKRRFYHALVLFFLFLLLPKILPQYTPWIEFLIASLIVWYTGSIFFKKGWTKSKLNMFSLISLGIFASYMYSAYLVLFSSSQPLYFETASTITLLVLLGQLLETKARKKTGQALSLLMARAPRVAHLWKHEEEKDIPIDQIQLNDLLIVKPGDTIPTDGILIRGQSFVDESLFTGEPFPVAKEKDSVVIGGTTNQSGSFIMKAEKIGKETALMRMVQLVAEAQRSKAPIQKIADTISAYFVPCTLVIALFSFLFWGFVAEEKNLSFAILCAVSVLIIACPCALGLATPLSLTVGIGKGAEKGIFFKNGEAIETLAHVQTVVFDKTGTLTEGHPKITQIYAKSPWKENELIQYAASLETKSNHPLANSILEIAKERNIELIEPQSFSSFSGRGLSGIVNKREVLVGNKRFMEQQKISISQDIGDALVVAIDGTVCGAFSYRDPIRSTSLETVQELKRLKIHVSMVTGDSTSAAVQVAQEVDIDSYASSCLPEDKCSFIKKLQNKKQMVAMVGDGVNDAPALSTSDVGIAIAQGSDVAIESGSVVLTSNNPLDVVQAITLSKKIMSNIRQNLFLAFLYNTLAIPVAAGLFFPDFHLVLSPEIASVAMIASSLCVVGNALRLKIL